MVWLAFNYHLGYLPPIMFLENGQRMTVTSEVYVNFVLANVRSWAEAMGIDLSGYVL